MTEIVPISKKSQSSLLREVADEWDEEGFVAEHVIIMSCGSLKEDPRNDNFRLANTKSRKKDLSYLLESATFRLKRRFFS